MDNKLPKPLIISISLIQGIVLTLLYQSIEQNFWPATNPVWLTSLATLAISLPLLTFLCITQSNIKETVKYIVPFAIVVSLLGAYVGYQQEPKEYINNGTAMAVFCFTALIASFKALMYIQQYISNKKVSYSTLFKLSWRNFIIFGECWLFVGIFWGILNLGAGLFAVLEIEFFKELLKKDWFVIPVLNLAFGFAIIVFRNIIHTVDNISTILQTLIKFLLPALTIVSLGFLITLPFTGLGALWKTGSGSLLVMWLQALTLFFVNTVYQDESHQRPYNLVLHRLVFIGVALLPIYSLISIYGLWLRIEQYGLTVDRCWAILVWALLACFSFGYLVGILRKRDAWLETLSSVNIAMGIAVLAAMLLVNSPILNFQYISAQSQLSRLEEGKISYDDFDYAYFGRSLGRQGYLQLQTLKEHLKEVSPEKIAIIDRMYVNHQVETNENSFSEFETLLTFWPRKEAFPEDLLNVIYEEETERRWSTYRGNTYYFVAQDLNDDGIPEYIVITENNYQTSADMWFKNNGKWESKYMTTHNPDENRYIKDSIQDSEIKTVKPKWNNLKVGNIEFKAQVN
ncbi:DUF4153 domain-containing protein [Pseudoalteromonas sp. T1lg122]|uniref:DUF4153 domain-containing protein n=1 Tax=Pseudoalteromonas sp. T1lg122 TaxID=2077094 RepID=UPI000CF6D213|nr:DUF4153 domain-containing protein [Pseudoalteromonas sp. T1lg122]